jgi:hypothetical protein
MSRGIKQGGRLVALAIGLTAALSGVAQAAAPSTSDSAAAPAAKALSARIPINYSITAHTGDRPNAGTDSDVHLRVYGTGGASPEWHLDNSDDNFERNKYDYFNYTAHDVGYLTRACVRFDRLWGWYAGWYLDWIRVNGVFFQFYRWFEQDGTVCAYRG